MLGSGQGPSQIEPTTLDLSFHLGAYDLSAMVTSFLLLSLTTNILYFQEDKGILADLVSILTCPLSLKKEKKGSSE